MKAISRSIVGMGLILMLQAMPDTPAAQTTDTAAIDPKAAHLMRGVADQLKSANTMTFTLGSDMKMQMGEMKQDVQGTYTASIQRPNKLALISKEGSLAGSNVSNGTTLTLYTEAENSYVQMPIQGSLEDLFKESGITMALPGIASLVAADPYASFMDGVTSATYFGVTPLNDTKVHHAIFEQDQFQWQAWVSSDTTTPVLRRMHVAMKPPGGGNDKGDDAGEESSAAESMKFETTMKYSDWNFNESIPVSTFQFNPPAGATDESDSMAEATGGDSEGDDEPHALLGHPAPPLRLNLLDGGSHNSADLTSTVIVLDFWASWCGPCRQALPVLDRIAAPFADQPVRFYAVNIEESTATVKEFVDQTKLKLRVAMDEEAEVSKAYGINSIPATFLIGADGIVQAVHEGLSPDAEEQLTSQVQALLRGETLVDKPTTLTTQSMPETGAEDPASTAPELQTAWSLPGTWTSAGYEPTSGVIVALDPKGMGAIINFDGKKTGDFKVEGAGGVLRLAQLNASPELELLTFNNWGREVRAFTSTGEQLWIKAGGQGIDDIWAGDLTGDGMQEVVVGYNGGTGVHALTPTGKPLWEYSKIGNVWHVCVANVTGDNTPEVITTSAAGKLHFFDAAGKKIKDIGADLYANMVRVATRGEKPATILAGGSGRDGELLAAYDADGKEQWSTLLQRGKSAHIDSAAVSADGDLVAVGLRGGTIIVLETATGEILGRATRQGRTPQVSWATDPTTRQTILLSPTENRLNALTVTHGE